MERCAIQLEATAEGRSVDATEFDVFSFLGHDENAAEPGEKKEVCPVCGAEMRLIDRAEKPRWRDILNSPHRPPWYRKSVPQRKPLALRPADPIEFAKGRDAAAPSPTRQSSTPDLSG